MSRYDLPPDPRPYWKTGRFVAIVAAVAGCAAGLLTRFL
jgi:hypothetical protein